MTQLLLDTNAFLWRVFENRRLSKRAARAIETASNVIHLSVASVWEIATKTLIGKLELGISFDALVQNYIKEKELTVLSIELEHISAYRALPLAHRDPFDRLLVAQAQVEGLTIVTADERFSEYDVKTLW